MTSGVPLQDAWPDAPPPTALPTKTTIKKEDALPSSSVTDAAVSARVQAFAASAGPPTTHAATTHEATTHEAIAQLRAELLERTTGMFVVMMLFATACLLYLDGIKREMRTLRATLHPPRIGM